MRKKAASRAVSPRRLVGRSATIVQKTPLFVKLFVCVWLLPDGIQSVFNCDLACWITLRLYTAWLAFSRASLFWARSSFALERSAPHLPHLTNPVDWMVLQLPHRQVNPKPLIIVILIRHSRELRDRWSFSSGDVDPVDSGFPLHCFFLKPAVSAGERAPFWVKAKFRVK
jgi:hypothetical protein